MDFLGGLLIGGACVTYVCPSCGNGGGSDYYNLYCAVEGFVKDSILKGLGYQQIRQTPTDDGRYLALYLGPSRRSVKVSFFSPFSFTDFYPSDFKL